MTVSKRLRFEILRRDNHACRYCGRCAPDVKLQVDHVVPETLGGSDDPSNLVTACADCNSGKSATPADAAVVASVAADAERWSAAMLKAAQLRSEEAAEEEDLLDSFECIWTAYWIKCQSENDTSTRYRHPGRWYAPRPRDWERSILRFISSGLDMDFFVKSVRRALYETNRVAWDETWRYFCGICWRELDHRREVAYLLLEEEK